MATARCACGEIVLTIAGEPNATVLCHCKDCQRRTGAPFGVGNYYTPDQVRISGSPKVYERGTDSGNRMRNFFCPSCGTTVYWLAGPALDRLGVATGTFDEPDGAVPVRSVYEARKHDWVDTSCIALRYSLART
ncbi:MAG: GFA family protein [Thalassobaculaceae bacterium]|nr:GFA family protein [Thalassobaculaceae bacterium]